MTDKPLPDSPEANRLGCSCPVSGNNKGEGVFLNGARSWNVNPKCPVHADPKWWMRRHVGEIR